MIVGRKMPSKMASFKTLIIENELQAKCNATDSQTLQAIVFAMSYRDVGNMLRGT